MDPGQRERAARPPTRSTRFRCETDREAFFERIERAAARRGLQPMRWPEPFPSDTAFAMRVATYAAQIGRAVAFSLAAFRQAFAGGRDLGVPDNVLIAAAACEMHPNAVAQGRRAALGRARAGRRDRAGGAAAACATCPPCGCRTARVFHGDEALDGAAQALMA